jgi:hypothetical protein
VTTNPTDAERLADDLARALAAHFAARSLPTWETLHAAARELREVGALRDTIATLRQERDAATHEAEALREKAGLPPIKTPWKQAMRETIQGQGLSMQAMGNELREKDAAIKELREEVGRLRGLLERVSDKLCHYATDYPQPDALSLINECDRALAKGHYSKPLPNPATWADTIPDITAEEAGLRASADDAVPQAAIEQAAQDDNRLHVTDDVERARRICGYRHHPLEDKITAALSAARAQGFTEGARQMQERAKRLTLAYADTGPTASQDDEWSACARELAEQIGFLPESDR